MNGIACKNATRDGRMSREHAVQKTISGSPSWEQKLNCQTKRNKEKAHLHK